MDLFEVINENEFFRLAITYAVETNIICFDSQAESEFSKRLIGLMKCHAKPYFKSEQYCLYIPKSAGDTIIHVIYPVEDYILLKDCKKIFNTYLNLIDDNVFYDYKLFHDGAFPYRKNNTCLLVGNLYGVIPENRDVLLGAF